MFRMPAPPVDPVIYLVDTDPDHAQSLASQLVRSHNDAFDRPSIVCEIIDSIPEDVTIRVVLNTHGGAASHCEKILKRLLKHTAGYVAYVRGECYSSGAIIALGAREIVMNEHSYLGKIDPQEDGKQCTIYAGLDNDRIDSANAYQVTAAHYALNYIDRMLKLIWPQGGKVHDQAVQILLHSNLPHQALFDAQQCKEMGLSVRSPATDEVCFFAVQPTKNYRKDSSGSGWLKYCVLGALLVTVFAIKWY